jgi:hypothetical protein
MALALDFTKYLQHYFLLSDWETPPFPALPSIPMLSGYRLFTLALLDKDGR